MRCTRKVRIPYRDGRLRLRCGERFRYARRVRELGRVVHVYRCRFGHELAVEVRR